MLKAPLDKFHNIISNIERFEAQAYRKGLNEGIQRLEMLSAVVPESVTKEQLFEMIKNETAALQKKI